VGRFLRRGQAEKRWAGAAGAAGACRARRKKEKEKIKDKDLRPEEDWDIPFAPPYERDATNQLKGARDYLSFKEPPWNTIVPLLQNILNAKSDSFFNIKDNKAGTSLITRRISVKTEANRIIAAFPEGRARVLPAVLWPGMRANLLDEAVKNYYDMAMLFGPVAAVLPHAGPAPKAPSCSAHSTWSAATTSKAAYAFERLLSRPNSDEFPDAANAVSRRRWPSSGAAIPGHKNLAQGMTDQLSKGHGPQRPGHRPEDVFPSNN